MLQEFPKAVEYLKKSGRDWDNYQKHTDFNYFESQWRKYLKIRNILDFSSKQPSFPSKYGPKERDDFYKSVSFDGWGGSSGHDCVIIAYDALLGAGDSWEELITRAALHGGDSDSTGGIAGAWWGVLHGFRNVPEVNYKSLEYGQKLGELSQQLLILSGEV